jgi:GT2 family glycosyltransferase
MEKSSQKIGVAIITYNRPDYYKKVLEKIPRHKINYLIVVNDGETAYANISDVDTVINNKTQLGVAKSKNKALNKLIDLGCEHLFLIEDDILIKNENVFEEYIKAANSTGIHHLCFEKVAGNEKSLKYTHEQPDGVKIGFYHNPQGAFMYVNAKLIEKLGYFDENYTNAFEHIDFAYNLIQKKVAPPFWYFPDIYNSDEYLEEIKGSSENSTITNKEKYQENWKKSAEYFTKKWGHFTNTIQDVGIKDLLKCLINLQINYSRKKLINKDKSLCVIVPYRDRKSALDKLIPELKNILYKQVSYFDIVIVEQNDNNLFNKGLLNNIAFLLNPNFDYYCFHDVDLIPEIADYSYPKNPVHMSTYCSQFKYIQNPDATMGGVIVFKKEHFEATNGYPNDYIGWGSEDRTLGNRVKKIGLNIYTHPFGKFYSVPHQTRLENQIEYDAHYVNGQKREDEFLGKTNMFDNGLKNIDLNKYNIDIDQNLDFKHIKINQI